MSQSSFLLPRMLRNIGACLLTGQLLLCACSGMAPANGSEPSAPEGMYRLGMQYGMGRPEQGIPPDYAQARQWLGQAAKQDYLPALHALAWLHYDGRGGPPDLAEAVRLFAQAAAMGYAESQYRLGLLYAQGEGVEKSSAISLEWIRRAADQGHPEARRLLDTLSGTGPQPGSRE